jgi:uncharacterized protein (TIGR02145 family)
MKFKFECGTAVDHKGRSYKTIKFGNQEWLAENLDTDEFINGDKIVELKPTCVNSWDAAASDKNGDLSWYEAHMNKMPAFTYLNSDPNYSETYGKLYNIWAIMDNRGVGIEGFRLPTLDDFLKLKELLGEESGRKLKSRNEVGDPNKTNWSSASGTKKGNNAIQFNGLPSGAGASFNRQINGIAYDSWNKYAIYWGDNSGLVFDKENPMLDPIVACLHYGEDELFAGNFSQLHGWMGPKLTYALSIRLVRDL